jgi:hypothetical protein
LELSDLLEKSSFDLDEIFSRSTPGPIPEGEATGEAIVCPGSFWSRIIARLVHSLAWKGKVFTRNPGGDGATLENRLTPVGVHAITARVYFTSSWFDGKDCIVLDYSKTSFFARKIRDEIRLIDPDRKIYLGKVWWGKKPLLGFALQFPR